MAGDTYAGGPVRVLLRQYASLVYDEDGSRRERTGRPGDVVTVTAAAADRLVALGVCRCEPFDDGGGSSSSTVPVAAPAGDPVATRVDDLAAALAREAAARSALETVVGQDVAGMTASVAAVRAELLEAVASAASAAGAASRAAAAEATRAGEAEAALAERARLLEARRVSITSGRALAGGGASVTVLAGQTLSVPVVFDTAAPGTDWAPFVTLDPTGGLVASVRLDGVVDRTKAGCTVVVRSTAALSIAGQLSVTVLALSSW